MPAAPAARSDGFFPFECSAYYDIITELAGGMSPGSVGAMYDLQSCANTPSLFGRLVEEA